MANELSALPAWLNYAQALGPTFVSLAVGCLGIYIAWRRWRTNTDKLILDLFDKRYNVYEATKDLLNSFARFDNVTPEILGNL